MKLIESVTLSDDDENALPSTINNTIEALRERVLLKARELIDVEVVSFFDQGVYKKKITVSLSVPERVLTRKEMYEAMASLKEI